MSPASNAPEPVPPDDDAQEAFWQSVYAAREKFYRQQIGELPEDILKIGHMLAYGRAAGCS